MKHGYQKVWFESVLHGRTAGLIVPAEQLKSMTISEVSRLFPYFEANKMKTLQVSPVFETWEAAFAFGIDGETK
jgi:hypothetical protein